MANTIELRVHAGAPSHRRDDDRYRAQAEAYLAFAGQRIDVEAASDGDDVLYNATSQGLRHIEAPEEDNATSDVNVYESDSQRHDMRDDGPKIHEPDATTFVEDTQLAYTVLESQIVTSSLPIPDVTPAKESNTNVEDTSPWPDDLDRHSPTEGLEEPGSSQAKSSSHESGVRSPVLHGLGRKRKVTAVLFKPFKIPTKRPASTIVQQPIPPSPDLVQLPDQREASPADRDTPSSYLETPVLDRSARKAHRAEHVDQQHPTTSAHTDTRTNGTRGQHADQSSSSSSRLQSPDWSRANKKPKLNDYRERTPQARPLVPYVPLQEGSQVGLAFIGDLHGLVTPARAGPRRQSQVSADGNETTSELPTSYSLSDLASQSSRARLRASQRSISEPGPSVACSGPKEHDGSNRSSSQPPKVRQAQNVSVGGPGRSKNQIDIRREIEPPISLPRDPRRAADTVLSGKDVHAAPRNPDLSDRPNSALETLKTLPVDIKPPEPAVSSDRFTTHITEALRFLADKSDVANSYKPVSVSRDLRPLERGYWLFDTSVWPTQLQLEFWQVLQQMVGTGNAGWGVWCAREESDAQTGNTLGLLGTLKVFCWGEVVRHVYLMLYVASQSKVRKLGLQWIDAEEKVVVQMRSA